MYFTWASTSSLLRTPLSSSSSSMARMRAAHGLLSCRVSSCAWSCPFSLKLAYSLRRVPPAPASARRCLRTGRPPPCKIRSRTLWLFAGVQRYLQISIFLSGTLRAYSPSCRGLWLHARWPRIARRVMVKRRRTWRDTSAGVVATDESAEMIAQAPAIRGSNTGSPRRRIRASRSTLWTW